MLSGLIWVFPFVFLLASIAILPLVYKHWWEKNYICLSLGLALLIVFHYAFQLKDISPILHTALDYFSFMSLIASLFIISGGIHINVKGEATPLVNTVFLFLGAVLANLLGTTGASMVLIRPWIRMNKYRITAFHIVLFIFIVSNVGGSLTPLGDPPLFLGYLKGVPFFWVFNNLLPLWGITLALLLIVFFILDSLNFKKAPAKIREKETAHEEWKFLGTHNLFFLSVVVGSIFVKNPPFLREIMMITAAFFSYKTTSKNIHESNDFGFGPIKEVAILFAGIFATMIPALEWLATNASQLGIHSPGQFFWGSGILSSLLDNAPTYLNFLSTSIGLFHPSGGSHLISNDQVAFMLTHHPEYIRAISAGSVFFGAVTYIGNGPNLLVKAIADHSHSKTPSFFTYFFSYSLPILIPIFFVVWYFFFRLPAQAL